MNIKKTPSGSALATIIAVLCLFAPIHVAASIKHSLSGQGESLQRGFGSGGGYSSGHGPLSDLKHLYGKSKRKDHKYKHKGHMTVVVGALTGGA